jgi:hypothetical protein
MSLLLAIEREQRLVMIVANITTAEMIAARAWILSRASIDLSSSLPSRAPVHAMSRTFIDALGAGPVAPAVQHGDSAHRARLR